MTHSPKNPRYEGAYLVTLGTPVLENPGLENRAFKRPKPLALLAYLCLEGPKERRHLADLFWPQSAGPKANLSVELSRLKRVTGGLLQLKDGRLVAELECDVAAFWAALKANDVERALGLYRGPFFHDTELPGVSAELTEWLDATREALAARRLEALLQASEARAAAGLFGAAAQLAEELLGAVSSLTATQVNRLYTLLTAAAHPAAVALQGASALGVVGDLTQVAARLQLSAKGPRTLGEQAAPSDFIGRRGELEKLLETLAGSARLVTVVGLAGMGKTRLALEVTARLQGSFEVYSVWLAGSNDPNEVVLNLAEAVGVDLGGGDLLGRTAATLGEGRCLVYIDNFEHVLTSAGVLVALLRGCPNLKLLVSSRERLNLGEEWVIWLEGLSCTHRAGEVSEAARLFLHRARRSDVSFRADAETLQDAELLCSRVGGSPLAIELAATWLSAMPCRDIAARLTQDWRVLSSRAHDAPARHRSVETAFDQSWRLLSPAQQGVLCALAVFRGGFSRAAAQEVVGADLGVLMSFIDKAFLSLSERGRYEQHPLIYEFLCAKLAQDPSRAAQVKRRHYRYYARLAEQLRLALSSPDQGSAFETLRSEQANLHLALHRALEQDAGAALRLTAALWYYWLLSGQVSLGADFCHRALALKSTPDQNAARAASLRGLGVMSYSQGDSSAAQRFLERGLGLATTVGDDRATAAILRDLGNATLQAGRYSEAHRHLDRALALYERLDDEAGVAESLHTLGDAALFRFDYAEARSYYLKSLSARRGTGDRLGTARTLGRLGSIASYEGEYGQAAAWHETSLGFRRALGVADVAASLRAAAAVHMHRGDHTSARQCLEEALALLRTLGDKRGQVAVSAMLADTRVTPNRHERREHLGRALELCRQEGFVHETCLVLEHLAYHTAPLEEQVAHALAQRAARLRSLHQLPCLPDERSLIETLRARLGAASETAEQASESPVPLLEHAFALADHGVATLAG